ncbi:DUF6966 domain-containing protein [Rhodoferax saidenbachensis]|uniref:DUF6966 domain-containing protein n=1 Tax=Rhodoferax saidenbachensis TaxID=1484693 RepID=A0ABU1ZQW9_9BURK|nr:hypothetical protein [Rhodoferax saidenbachensis]MDR7307944.1 hypothetical protein [Rhodoferax saidenbachensis]
MALDAFRQLLSSTCFLQQFLDDIERELMSTGLTIVVVLLGITIGAWVWWKLFNTPDGERYLKMRTQGPFAPINADAPDKAKRGDLDRIAVEDTPLHIVYTESEMLLSKKAYASWREIQDEYQEFKSSLGPWPADEVIEYLESDYPKLEPSASVQVSTFIAMDCETHRLTFKETQAEPLPHMGERSISGEAKLVLLIETLSELVTVLALDPSCQWHEHFQGCLSEAMGLRSGRVDQKALSMLSASIRSVYGGAGSFNDYVPVVFDAAGSYAVIKGAEGFEALASRTYDLALELVASGKL